MSSRTAKRKIWDLPYKDPYANFDHINGLHPFGQIAPHSVVMYSVRKLPAGQVVYFNYDLAEEMGLLPKGHARTLSPKLEGRILDTFAIQIINEFDLSKGISYDSQSIKPNKFMATRYLQLQHKNKNGLTSGDGRSIWNGRIKHGESTWDISSRGTGVTRLSPGFVQANKPLKTGGTEFGYGCGTADIDELISAALMSEIYHRRGINTERTLTIIDLGQGVAIGVRASENLFRPAHLFRLHKLNKQRELKSVADFLIQQQVSNGRWSIQKFDRSIYFKMLFHLSKTFAQFAARLEADYMFVWLDWDGDNVLFDPGIIDYGSVRQFGLFHDSYRYDDVDRYSTSIGEQKSKAREITKIFAQIANTLSCGVKRPLSDFRKHWSLKNFDREFERHRIFCYLRNIGFDSSEAQKLMNTDFNLCLRFMKLIRYFEKQKTKRKTKKLPDGVIRPAIFNLRSLWLKLPQRMLENNFVPLLDLEMFDIMLAKSASGKDRIYQKRFSSKIFELQDCYMTLIEKCSRPWKHQLCLLAKNARDFSRRDRMTGNGIEIATQHILKEYSKGLAPSEIQKIMESVIQNQSATSSKGRLILISNPKTLALLSKIQSVLVYFSEDI